MKFNHPKFKRNLNLEVYLKWVQVLERVFEIKEYTQEKAFKTAILKLKKHASLWYENTKKVAE